MRSNTCFAMGFVIDELYGMGHMMAYGIAAISAIIIFRPFKHRTVKVCTLFVISLFFVWHGTIKYSIWQGLSFYRQNQYEKSIPHLKRVVDMYPKPDARFHYFLGEMYLEIEFVPERESSFCFSRISSVFSRKTEFF